MGHRSNYTSKQHAEITLSVFTKQVTAAEACRRHGITETTLGGWRVGRIRRFEQSAGSRVFTDEALDELRHSRGRAPGPNSSGVAQCARLSRRGHTLSRRSRSRFCTRCWVGSGRAALG